MINAMCCYTMWYASHSVRSENKCTQFLKWQAFLPLRAGQIGRNPSSSSALPRLEGQICRRSARGGLAGGFGWFPAQTLGNLDCSLLWISRTQFRASQASSANRVAGSAPAYTCADLTGKSPSQFLGMNEVNRNRWIISRFIPSSRNNNLLTRRRNADVASVQNCY